MKKLSIEQKAQKYDEAIERAKKHYEECKMRGNDWFVEDIEDMFPELSESEDEKIRKAILEHIQLCTESIPDRDKFITWLEKQGEQKPHAWSEEDELYIRELESLVKQVWATAEHENDKDTIYKMRDLSFFLKTLKPQLKQEILEKLEEWLDEYVSDLTDVDTASLICSFTNYLDGKLPKSLRPKSQWRPSYEQMWALSTLANIPEIASDACKKTAKELLEQLKKLSEE